MNLTPSLATTREDYLRPYTGLTRDLYVYQLDRWIRWCRDNGLDPFTVRRTDIERFVHHLRIELGHKASSVHTALTPVRGFYRFAYAEGVIERDPAVLARRPRYVSSPRDTVGLDREQMRALLNAGTASGGRYCATAYLLVSMALRATEACSIRIEDYQQTVRGHRVLEFTGKAGVPARIPLPVPVVRALDISAEGRTTVLLITRRDGLPLHRRGLYTVVRTLSRRAGLDLHVTPHLLRHSCITNALESGASLRKVQDLARHSEPRTTMRYDRNRTNLDDHAGHTLVAWLAPPETEFENRYHLRATPGGTRPHPKWSSCSSGPGEHR